MNAIICLSFYQYFVCKMFALKHFVVLLQANINGLTKNVGNPDLMLSFCK